MKRLVNEKGLTLVEAVIAATLMAVVLCGSLLLYERGVRDWLWTEEYTEVVDNLRIAADKMASEVRGATEVGEPNVGETKKERLIFDRPSREPDVVRETITYEIVSNVLRWGIRREYSDGRTTTSTNPVTTAVIEVVYFSRPSTAVVEIELIGNAPKTSPVSVRTVVYARALRL
jgi:Tfp pilus assembly protein PilW